MNMDEIVGVMERATGAKGKRTGTSGWVGRCPGHDDSTPSLSIAVGKLDGKVVMRCMANCRTDDVLSRVGLTMADLMGNGNGTHLREAPKVVFKTIDAAVADIELRLGVVSKVWQYHNAEGVAVGAACRWDASGNRRKEIRPLRCADGRWTCEAMASPRPLFKLPELLAAPGETVYVVAGEKCADAGASIGLLCTTASGGEGAHARTDWTPLSGREVVLLPDNDAAGRAWTDELCDTLTALGCRVRIVWLPGVGDGGDVADYVEARDGMDGDAIRAEIEALVAAVPYVAAENADTAYVPFPTDTLPAVLADFIHAGAEALVCDESFLALPMLSVCGAAIGNRRRIKLKNGWCEPSAIWTLVVGESGTVKTPAFQAVTRPVHDLQNSAFKQHAAALEGFETSIERHKEAKRRWKSEGAVGEMPAAPPKPIAKRYHTADPTVEALAPILQENGGELLLARDEMSGWFASHGAYKKNGRGSADEAGYLSMFNAVPLVVDRKLDRAVIHVPRALVSITGGIQPGVLTRVMGDAQCESGLAARFLYAYPPRRPKVWSEGEVSDDIEQAYQTVVRKLYDLQPGITKDGDAVPVDMRLAPDAKLLWIEFENEHGQAGMQHVGEAAATWSKLEAYGARFALVIHCVRIAAGEPVELQTIDADSMRRAIDLARWFCVESLRVLGVTRQAPEQVQEDRIIEMAKRKGGTATLREISRSCFGRNMKRTRDALKAMEADGIGAISRLEPGASGGRPSEVFVLAKTEGASPKPTQKPKTPPTERSE